VADLVAFDGRGLPKLQADKQRITEVLRVEEERFFETLATGMEILESTLARWRKGVAR